MEYEKVEIWHKRIHIKPEPKQSVQFNRKTGASFTPAKKKEYQNAVFQSITNSSYIPVPPWDGPLAVKVIFSFPYTKSEQSTKKKVKLAEDNGNWFFALNRVDLDNLLKPVSDAMNKVLIKDDSHITHAELIKIKTPNAFIDITLYRLEYKEIEHAF